MSLASAAFDAAWYSGVHRVLGKSYRAKGSILMLHRVYEDDNTSPFQPNRDLAISARFLRQLLDYYRSEGWAIVTLDEVVERLEAVSDDPFVCFTFDDGYLDNLDVALPVFREFDAPLAVYLTTGFIDRTHLPWWYLLEDILKDSTELDFEIDGERIRISTSTTREKQRAFDLLRNRLVGSPDVTDKMLDTLLHLNGSDTETYTSGLVMNWNDVARLAEDELVTLGAHGMSHLSLSKLDEEHARQEIIQPRTRIAAHCGIEPKHYCFPFGGPAECGQREFDLVREAGFRSATTTRKSNLVASRDYSVHALPRIYVKGSLQHTRYISMNMSGFIPAFYGLASRG